ncbi:enoyl-CoA hydratase/isomerase family protein [Faecalibacter rhinopitheci]|uniref:Enoyl-CoA hydratase/isomerase family protein n=1 Tax=Faecalibacter rhinopitheci TaxID=2779678 RepID=A0A8J7FPZ2_9FLAO|nr:enoyl-CoA hydratase/isomerase family protein [Faecalibacter rhinopitheci]MBF0595948.1 enoyl-CoA hydratase/isomerase family protein [Faecalibacter rhinopitheci]
MEAYVKSDIQNGIGTIEFYHYQSNSMPGSQLRNLAAEIEKLGNDETVKVIILKSAGERTFCAGASFDELISIKDRETGLDFFSGFAHVINAIRKASKFVLARIQGKAVGGGVGIASAADYTFATQHAAVKLSELAVGIGPFVVGPAVERKVGTSAFTHMAINATEFQTAQWAKEKGLYAEVFPTVEEMDASIETLATKLAGSNPDAMKHLKRVSWEGTENWDELLIERAKISGELVLSEFTINAINKFKAK